MTELSPTLDRDEQGYRLCLVRRLDASLAEVWAALTEPARLAVWLAETKLEAVVGGRIEIAFAPDETIYGEILELSPQKRLTFTWSSRPDAPRASVVCFELERAGSGTRLRLTHSRQSTAEARGTCAGWDAQLDLFVAALAGQPADWEPAYAAAMSRWEDRVEALFG